jgi:hypothetical protein
MPPARQSGTFPYPYIFEEAKKLLPIKKAAELTKC